MKQVKRWRYYCDFCKKASGHKSAMEKHEKGCTLNPNRVCGFCAIAEEVQAPMDELKAALGPIMPPVSDEYLTFGPTVSIDKLREVSNNCPACILAAIRQRKDIECDFNFKEESAAFWKSHNADVAAEQHCYGYY